MTRQVWRQDFKLHNTIRNEWKRGKEDSPRPVVRRSWHPRLMHSRKGREMRRVRKGTITHVLYKPTGGVATETE